MGRSPCCDKNGLKKGPWTAEEDQKLIDYIQKHGYGNWRTLPKNAGLQRCGKSCRLRWTNYLRPDIKRGRFSFEEEETIIQLHSILGNKWSAIAARLPGRTDNEIKNYWNTHIRKRLLRMGIDPVTHSPRLDLLDLSSIMCNSSLYNTTRPSSSQTNMFGLQQQSLVNPELLKIATSLLSTQGAQNSSSSLIQDPQIEGFSSNAQMQSSFNNPIVRTTNNQIQTSIQNSIQDCTIMTTTATTAAINDNSIATTSCTNPCSHTFFGEVQVMGTNFGEYPSNIPSFDHQTYDQWQSQGLSLEGLVNVDDTTSLSYYRSDQTIMDPSISDNCTFQSKTSGQHQSIMSFTPSVMSTPSSSPTSLNWTSNSNCTYINNYGLEYEGDNYYCSDMIKIEIPDMVDARQFMLAQNC